MKNIDKKNELTFEEAFNKLENYSKSLKNNELKLEDAIFNFEEGIKYYEYCNEILKKAKQKVEIYTSEREV